MRSPGYIVIAVVAAGALASGCISNDMAPPADSAMCEASSDCDQGDGEICDEGICWGGPPQGLHFAAVLVPPAERSDLPVTEIGELVVADDGTASGLDFGDSVRIHGRVLLGCPAEGEPSYACGLEQSIGAELTIERTSVIPGGPDLSRTIVATANVGAGQDAFSFVLPKGQGLSTYRVTVAPTGVDGGSVSPEQLAPPTQFVVSAEQDLQADWVVGDPATLKLIRGCVEDVVGDGSGFQGMQVKALGRWSPLSPLTRASALAETDSEGCFELTVPRGMRDDFDIVVSPGAGSVKPTLRLANLLVPDPPPEQDWGFDIQPALVMPSSASPTTFKVPIEATGNAGGQERVAGATVRFETFFEVPDGEMREVTVSYAVQAVTSDLDSQEPGVASVMLYPGSELNRIYTVQVVPPSGSPYGAAFGLEVPVGLGGAQQVLQSIALGRRVALTGTTEDQFGNPIEGAAIEASAASALRLSLDEGAGKSLLGQLQFPVDTTDEGGGFLVWVDRLLAGEAASYDILVQPPAPSGAPSWSFESIEIPHESSSLDVGALTLPAAAYARGILRDPDGEIVHGAELHLYQLANADICAEVQKQGDCVPPAWLRGVSASDASGRVVLRLPDP